MPPFFVALIICAALISSGCTLFDPGTPYGDGIVIESFEPDFPEIYSGEKFKLEMMVRNTGSVDAYNVYPRLFNIGNSNAGLEITCQDPLQYQEKAIELLAYDPEDGTQGESQIYIWDCFTPNDVKPGNKITFNPGVRLYYIYKTHALRSINMATQDELRSIQASGRALPSETVGTTSGPVSLGITVSGPIRYSEDDCNVRFPVNINIENNGGGVACTSDAMPYVFSPVGFAPFMSIISDCQDTGTWNRVYMSFETEDKNTRLICDERHITGRQPVELWKGESRKLTCEVEIDLGEYPRGLTQKTLKVSLHYGYFIDSTTSVDVLGR